MELTAATCLGGSIVGSGLGGSIVGSGLGGSIVGSGLGGSTAGSGLGRSLGIPLLTDFLRPVIAYEDHKGQVILQSN